MRRRALLIVVLAVVTGCGTSGRTIILTAPDTKTVSPSIEVREGKSTAAVPADVKAAFVKYLDWALYEKRKFSKGNGLTLVFRFIQFNPGNRFIRWLSSGLGGHGTIAVEAKFYDGRKKLLANIQVHTSIRGGGFGGSVTTLGESAADDLAKYVIKTFGKR